MDEHSETELLETPVSAAPQAEPGEFAPSAAPARLTAEELARLRKHCIAQYEIIALGTKEPLQACLGLVTADLFGIVIEMGPTLNTMCDGKSLDDGTLGKLERPVDMYLRLMRQTDRLANLLQRMADTGKRKAGNQIETK